MGLMNLARCITFYCMPSAQKTDTECLKRILVIRNDHIGDVCLTLPFLSLIKQFKPDIRLSVLVHEYTEDIVSGNPLIDRIIVQHTHDSVQDIIAETDEYDALFNLCSTGFNAQICSRIVSRYKTGYAYKPYNMLSFNRFTYVKRSNPPVHETDFCFSFAEAIGIPAESYRKQALRQASIHIPEETETWVAEYMKNTGLGTGKPLIAIHAGDFTSAMNLSVSQYAEIGRRCLRALEADIVYLFGPSEKNLAAGFPDSLRKQCFFIEGDLTLKQLACFISHADCFISGSTGPMHIAGIMETPTVSIFSENPAHAPEKWHPIKNSRIIITPEEPYARSSETSYMETVDLDNVISGVTELIEAKPAI